MHIDTHVYTYIHMGPPPRKACKLSVVLYLNFIIFFGRSGLCVNLRNGIPLDGFSISILLPPMRLMFSYSQETHGFPYRMVPSFKLLHKRHEHLLTKVYYS